MSLRQSVFALVLILHGGAFASEQLQKRVAVPNFSGKTLQQVQAESIDKATGKSIFAAIDTPQGPTDGVVSSQNPVANEMVVPGTTRLVLTMKGPSLLQTILQAIGKAQPAKPNVPPAANTQQPDVPSIKQPPATAPDNDLSQKPQGNPAADAPEAPVVAKQPAVADTQSPSKTAAKPATSDGTSSTAGPIQKPPAWVPPPEAVSQPVVLSTSLVLLLLASVTLTGGVGFLVWHAIHKAPDTNDSQESISAPELQFIPHAAAARVQLTTAKPGLRFTLTFRSTNSAPEYIVHTQPAVRSTKAIL